MAPKMTPKMTPPTPPGPTFKLPSKGGIGKHLGRDLGVALGELWDALGDFRDALGELRNALGG